MASLCLASLRPPEIDFFKIGVDFGTVKILKKQVHAVAARVESGHDVEGDRYQF